MPAFAGSLDDLAEALAFEVNAVHSQGVGQSAESSLTTLYQATDADEAMASTDSGLHYWERIDNSGTAGFKIHVYDANGDPLVAGGDTITIAADMTLNQLATAIDGVNGLSASVNASGQLTISAAAGEGGSSFAFSEDSSGVLAALGLNAFFSGHDASTLAVVATSESIAAAKVQSDSTFGLGDGSNALDIADLEDTRVDVGGTTQTFGDALGALLGDIAVEAASVERRLTFQDSMVEQLTIRRDAETGVSLDEELTNMIKFQHAYTAAAKLLKAADDMLATLIGMK
jgi:flagellar hook-associated protein 1 FlgK